MNILDRILRKEQEVIEGTIIGRESETLFYYNITNPHESSAFSNQIPLKVTRIRYLVDTPKGILKIDKEFSDVKDGDSVNVIKSKYYFLNRYALNFGTKFEKKSDFGRIILYEK